MRKLLLLAVPLLLLGCGGADPFRGETDFAGAWNDVWSSPGTPNTGQMTFTIGTDAVMHGTFTNTATGEAGSLSGSVHPNGGFRATVDVNGSNKRIQLEGKMQLVEVTGSSTPLIAGDGTMDEGTGKMPFTFDPGVVAPTD